MELNQWSPKETKKKVIHTDSYNITYEDKTTIDIQCGNASYILGYSNKNILNAITNTKVQFLRGNNGETSNTNEELINIICSEGNWDSLAWAVSGSDAVEAAINMNDKYWEYQGKNKPKILTFKQSYHGCTMLAKHLRGEYEYLGRAILLDPTSYVSIKQRALIEKYVLMEIEEQFKNNQDIGCFLMETVPWSTGPYSKEWWLNIRNLCDKYNVLMIVDDIALCWGKLGTLFGYQFYGVQPDISTISKSLTGGYSPLAAAVCNTKVAEVLKYHDWIHTQTYLPNMQGVSAALAATKEIKPLLDNVPYINQRLQDIAKNLGFRFKGEGLFVTFETSREILMADLYNVGLSATIRGDNSIRIIAPLVADEYYFSQLEARLKMLL